MHVLNPDPQWYYLRRYFQIADHHKRGSIGLCFGRQFLQLGSLHYSIRKTSHRCICVHHCMAYKKSKAPLSSFKMVPLIFFKLLTFSYSYYTNVKHIQMRAKPNGDIHPYYCMVCYLERLGFAVVDDSNDSCDTYDTYDTYNSCDSLNKNETAWVCMCERHTRDTRDTQSCSLLLSADLDTVRAKVDRALERVYERLGI